MRDEVDNFDSFSNKLTTSYSQRTLSYNNSNRMKERFCGKFRIFKKNHQK